MTIHDTQPIPPVPAAVLVEAPADETGSGSRYALYGLVAALLLAIGGLAGAVVASSVTFTQAEIEQARESGFADGYDSGLAEGTAVADKLAREAFQSGYDSGYTAGLEAQDDGGGFFDRLFGRD